MAFPFVTEGNFEDGTLGHFDTESDSATRLDFAHYSDLARIPGLSAPWRGAYVMRVNLATATTDAYVQETGSWDMTAGTNDLYLRTYFYLSPDLVMATTNEFKLVDFWSSTNTPEAGAMVNFTTANGFRLGIGKATASSFLPLTLGEWHCLELFFDPAGSSNGTLDGWLDGASFTQVTGLTNADITSGVVGVIGQDAGTTRGYVLFDQVITDDARIFPDVDRYTEEVVLTKSGHVFVGHGELENLTLGAGAATDCVAEVYDTDTGTTSAFGNRKIRLTNTANSETVDPAGVPIRVRRGCYVSLSGTNPQAIAKIKQCGAYSEGTVRAHGLNRAAPPPGA